MNIKDIRLNASFNEEGKKIDFNKSPFFSSKVDDETLYMFKNSYPTYLNANGLDDMTLVFKNDTLKRIVFEKIGYLDDGVYENELKKLVSKYGEPLSFPVKGMYRRYEWHNKDIELTLKPLKISYLLIYNKKTSQKHQWPYIERKGKGDNSVQLTISNWEDLINSNLTIAEFEKRLPEWESKGSHNYIDYNYNHKTEKLDIPEYTIDYKLNNCDIEIRTSDTVSKKIAEYKFFNINNPFTVNNIRNSLNASNYEIDDTIKAPPG